MRCATGGLQQESIFTSISLNQFSLQYHCISRMLCRAWIRLWIRLNSLESVWDAQVVCSAAEEKNIKSVPDSEGDHLLRYVKDGISVDFWWSVWRGHGKGILYKRSLVQSQIVHVSKKLEMALHLTSDLWSKLCPCILAHERVCSSPYGSCGPLSSMCHTRMKAFPSLSCCCLQVSRCPDWILVPRHRALCLVLDSSRSGWESSCYDLAGVDCTSGSLTQDRALSH